MSNRVVITGAVEVEVNGVKIILPPQTSYPLVQEDKGVLEDGGIVFYNTIEYEDQNIDVPAEDSVVTEWDDDVPPEGTVAERFYDAYADTTEDYITAYNERLGIEVNPYADVDRDSFIDHDQRERML